MLPTSVSACTTYTHAQTPYIDTVLLFWVYLCARIRVYRNSRYRQSVSIHISVYACNNECAYMCTRIYMRIHTYLSHQYHNHSRGCHWDGLGGDMAHKRWLVTVWYDSCPVPCLFLVEADMPLASGRATECHWRSALCDVLSSDIHTCHTRKSVGTTQRLLTTTALLDGCGKPGSRSVVGGSWGLVQFCGSVPLHGGGWYPVMYTQNSLVQSCTRPCFVGPGRPLALVVQS